ncbi:MAG TPA: FtsX-like permease family protein [Vicinamibacterales bacterium]|nr:FtsX-like permease family protein [Vicinamibacterales bacterium]
MSWRLFKQFILRPLLKERARTITTTIGIALGVGVVIAIQLTNASSVRGFETALSTVAGKAGIEIVGTGGINESLLPELGWLREFGAASAVIEGEMAIVEGTAVRPAQRVEALKVLGVDILRDLTLREYVVGAAATSGAQPEGLGGDTLTPQRFLELLTSPQSVVITEKLARRRGYSLGDEIRLMAGDRVNTYVIRGLLKDEGPARVMDGSFVLMDIAAAQLAFDRLGRVDRIDVVLAGASDNAAIDAAVEGIGARLPDGLTAQRPGRRGQQVERMLAAFHLNLTALSWVSLVVGLFLVYNTVTISVIARRDEIGTLRALGVTRGQVLALFLGEAAALGLAGTIVGIGLGRLLADVAVDLTSRTVSTLYIATAAVPPALTPGLIALAFAIGIPLSLVAAWLPSREASLVSPTAAMRGHDRLESRVHLRPRALLLPLAVLILAGGLATLPPINGQPLFGYASSFVTIIGASLLVPAIIYGLARVMRGPLRRMLGVEGLLAHANLSAAIPRLSISVAALAVSLSMMVAVAVMIGSFRDTVVYWVGQTLQADLFIGPGMRPTAGSEQTLSATVIDAVRAHPDVAAVDSFRNIDLVYNNNLVVLGAGNFDIVLSHGSLLFKEPADGREALRRAIGTESVVVSEVFANKYDTKPGDTLMLQTPAGPRPFAVVAVYYDYAVDRGVIVMDRATFVRYFGELAPSGVAAYLKPGAEPEQVRSEILAGLDEGHRAFIYTNRALRAEVLRIFDSTFAITYALEIIAVVVAMLGVGATLLTLVIERRRELSMLRLIGAARRQVQRVVVIEAALIGAASQAIGLVVGLVLSVLLVYVINVQSFGWTIQFRIPVAFLAQVSIAVVIATALAGIYPARQAARLVLTQDE